jgi:hypothetical protein
MTKQGMTKRGMTKPRSSDQVRFDGCFWTRSVGRDRLFVGSQEARTAGANAPCCQPREGRGTDGGHPPRLPPSR